MHAIVVLLSNRLTRRSEKREIELGAMMTGMIDVTEPSSASSFATVRTCV
jgi:hypothetical protein